MLNVRLEPGQALDKQVSLAASAFKELFDVAKEEGILRVYSTPSLEALVASSMAFALAARRGIDSSLSVSLEPPRKVYEPSIVIGFDSLNYTNELVKDKLVAVSQSLKETPPVNATYLSVDGSLGAALYLVARNSEGLRPEPELSVVSLASSYASRYASKDGRLNGLDKLVATLLSGDESLELELLTALKSYRPHLLPLCSSLAVTLDPYYPGITGNESGCREVLGRGGLDTLADRKVTDLSDDELRSVARVVISYVKERMKRQLEVTDFVGGTYVASEKLVISDPREFLGAFASIADVAGLGSAVALVTDYEVEYPQVQRTLAMIAAQLRSFVEGWAPMGEASLAGVRVVKVRSASRPPLYLLWKALSLVGAANGGLLLAHELGNGQLVASALQAVEALGLQGVRKLLGSEGAELKGLEIWLKQPAS